MVRLGKVSRALGAHGEGLAAKYLESHGFEIIERNWRCEHGELDIVAYEPATRTLVFVEVKTRSGVGFGAPLEAVHAGKAHKLYQLAHLWLTARRARASRMRVDAVGVLLGGPEPEFSHVKGVMA